LGSGDFVTEALQKAGQPYEAQSGHRPLLEALADTVSKAFGVSAEQLKSGSRRRTIVQARSVLAWIAVRLHGYNGVEIAEAFSLSSPTVSRIIEKGEIILDNNRELAVDLRIK
jgi:chromosomal replication initiation ATPase DnaA